MTKDVFIYILLENKKVGVQMIRKIFLLILILIITITNIILFKNFYNDKIENTNHVYENQKMM